MDFRSFWQSLGADQKTAFAVRIGKNRTYLAQIACGFRQPSPTLARQIHSESGYQVQLHIMRPDIWDAA